MADDAGDMAGVGLVGVAVMERLTPFAGQLAACTCGKQPRLLQRLGKDVYALDCPPCGVRTGFHKSAQEAVAEWETARAKSQEITA